MAIKKYYDSDCNLGVLDGKTVAVIGFGSQGHAHSENLAESGVNVVVGLRKGSGHWEKAAKFAETCPNFHVMEVEEAAKSGSHDAMEEELGDLLLTVTSLARKLGVDSEKALGRAVNKFVDRFERVEDEAAKDGKRPDEMSMTELDAIWDRIKHEKM